MTAGSQLPRSPGYFLDRLADLHARVRDRVRAASASEDMDHLSAATDTSEGDTIFTIDLHAEEILDAFFSTWGEEIPLLLIAEGIAGDGGRTYPPGTEREETAFTCIVDPIDGTRGLMYGKRSAWILSAIAPPPHGALPTLADIRLAMQTELPTLRSHLSDALWAVAGSGVEGETRNLESGEVRPLHPQPSRADSLLYGFATISKFFPGTKLQAAEIEERLMRALYGSRAEGALEVFDDEYISTAGQLYELTVGHDRFVADLRPLFLPPVGEGAYRLCAHPYDLCTELIAREAGVVVTDERGGPLHTPLDIRERCGWIGYANRELERQIAPILLLLLPAGEDRTPPL